MLRVFSRGRWAGLLCSAAAVLGLSGGAATAGEISIGHSVWVGYGPLYIARDKGYFKDDGVTVNLRVVDDTALALAAQASGHLDGAAVTIDEILKYRSKDFCFKAVTVLDESHGGDGVVAIDAIKTLGDLKGKTVAMNEGTTSQFWFSYLLKKKGIALNDITVTNMSADDAAAAFIAGRVPAAVTWEPNLTLVKTKKVGHVLVDSSTTPGVIVDVISLNCKVIKDQPHDVLGLVKGLNKAAEFLKTNPNEAYEIMAKGVGGYLKDPKDFAAAAAGVKFYDQAMTKAYLGTPEKPGSIAGVIKLGNDIWTELGRMKAPVSYDDVVDSKFVQ